jgi:hypothetical protein
MDCKTVIDESLTMLRDLGGQTARERQDPRRVEHADNHVEAAKKASVLGFNGLTPASIELASGRAVGRGGGDI